MRCGSGAQQERQRRLRPLRVGVIGDSGVGKSALTVRFLTRRFIGEYLSDTDLLYKFSMNVDDGAQPVEIMDPSSSCSVTETHMQWADAFVLVYDITNKKSFIFAKNILEALDSQRPTAPLILLGTKSDLSHQREVEEVDARCLAMRHSCKFHEISSAESSTPLTTIIENFLKDVKYFPRNSRLVTRVSSLEETQSKASDSRLKSQSKNLQVKDFHTEVGTNLHIKNCTPNFTSQKSSAKPRKLSVSKLFGGFLNGKNHSSHNDNPITQLIVLDRRELLKTSNQVAHL